MLQSPRLICPLHLLTGDIDARTAAEHPNYCCIQLYANAQVHTVPLQLQSLISLKI